MFSIAHNLCKNEYRRINRNILESREDVETLNITQETAVEKQLDAKFFTRALHRQLDLLRPEQKSAFILRFQENLSTREISTILNCPEGTVKSRLFYLTKKLAGQLVDFHPHEE